MLARRQRLAAQRIEYLLKKGRKQDTTSFRAKYLPTSRQESRFCVIVSTKTEPKAVKRNLLRRRLYEAMRLHQNFLQKPHDIVLITRIPIMSLDYQNLVEQMKTLFNTLK